MGQQLGEQGNLEGVTLQKKNSTLSGPRYPHRRKVHVKAQPRSTSPVLNGKKTVRSTLRALGSVTVLLRTQSECHGIFDLGFELTTCYLK